MLFNKYIVYMRNEIWRVEKSGDLNRSYLFLAEVLNFQYRELGNNRLLRICSVHCCCPLSSKDCLKQRRYNTFLKILT